MRDALTSSVVMMENRWVMKFLPCAVCLAFGGSDACAARALFSPSAFMLVEVIGHGAGWIGNFAGELSGSIDVGFAVALMSMSVARRSMWCTFLIPVK